MTAFLLFAANFALVFTLGLQQLNVNADRRGLAFMTSLLISGANLVLFKVLPGPIDLNEIAGYALGGAIGIVASMWAHPRLIDLLAPAPLHCDPCHGDCADCIAASRMGYVPKPGPWPPAPTEPVVHQPRPDWKR
jgi:hypothetical protein